MCHTVRSRHIFYAYDIIQTKLCINHVSRHDFNNFDQIDIYNGNGLILKQHVAFHIQLTEAKSNNSSVTKFAKKANMRMNKTGYSPKEER